jgi:OST-HTH/LOTUS domain
MVYGFGERKTPKPFVAACDKFIYTENLADTNSPTGTSGACKPKQATSAAQLKADTALVNHLRNAVEAASDDDGWASLANIGHIITKQRSDFDSRNYGYAKLSDLITATTLFEIARRSPGKANQPSSTRGTSGVDKRRNSNRGQRARERSPTNRLRRFLAQSGPGWCRNGSQIG